MPTPRRRPWGQLWSAAPWDGKARDPEPLRIPATDAALIDTPPPRGTLSLRRRGWGKLFAAAPWHARPTPALAAVVPAPAEVLVPPGFDQLMAALPADPRDDGGVDFDFEPDTSGEATTPLTRPPEVLS